MCSSVRVHEYIYANQSIRLEVSYDQPTVPINQFNSICQTNLSIFLYICVRACVCVLWDIFLPPRKFVMISTIRLLLSPKHTHSHTHNTNTQLIGSFCQQTTWNKHGDRENVADNCSIPLAKQRYGRECVARGVKFPSLIVSIIIIIIYREIKSTDNDHRSEWWNTVANH